MFYCPIFKVFTIDVAIDLFFLCKCNRQKAKNRPPNTCANCTATPLLLSPKHPLKSLELTRQKSWPSSVCTRFFGAAANTVSGSSFQLKIPVKVTVKSILKNDMKDLKLKGKSLTFDPTYVFTRTKVGHFLAGMMLKNNALRRNSFGTLNHPLN